MEQIFSQIPRLATGPNFTFLALAFLNTFGLAALSCVIGSALGFGLAAVRLTKSWYLLPLRVLSIAIVEIFRRVPPLVVLLLVFFAFALAKTGLPPFVVALVALCLIATAFIAEIIRGGFDSVHQAQWEAAVTMNFSLLDTLRLVVMPQAWRVVIPTVFVFFVMFIKDSALASQVGVMELTFAGKSFIDRGFSPFLSFGVILVLYFVLSYPLALVGRRLEKKLATSHH